MLITFLRKNRQTTQTPKLSFQELFYQNPLHQWILEDKYLSRGVQLFLDALTPLDQQNILARKRQLILTPASGRYSCAMNGTDKFEFIIVFPDLVQILRSAAPERGVAILLHEAGHLTRRHSERSLTALEAQLEADRFCAKRGYAQALRDFLTDLPMNDEIDLRLRYLETLNY